MEEFYQVLMHVMVGLMIISKILIFTSYSDDIMGTRGVTIFAM